MSLSNSTLYVVCFKSGIFLHGEHWSRAVTEEEKQTGGLLITPNGLPHRALHHFYVADTLFDNIVV